jgi:hypothetical protein
MSTAYFVHCRSCDRSDTAEFNRPGPAQERIDTAWLLAAMDKAFPTCEVEMTHGYSHVSFSYYADHWQHDLVVKDEYGRYHERGEVRLNVVEAGDSTTLVHLPHCVYPVDHRGPCNVGVKAECPCRHCQKKEGT